MIVDSLDGQGCPAHVPCQAFDGFPVGAVNGLSHMNVESGVVVPRHQPFDFVAVKNFLIFQRAQKPGTEVNGNSDRGASLQFMKTSFPNKPGKHQRMNMGMEVEQAAVGPQTEESHRSGHRGFAGVHEGIHARPAERCEAAVC